MDWISIECRRKQANCYEEAAEVCPTGYDVADSGGQSGTYMQKNQDGSTTAVPIYKGHMLIKCKTATNEQPPSSD